MYVFEFQFHTPESLVIKEVNHKLYEKERLKETSKEEVLKSNEYMKKSLKNITMPNKIEKIRDIGVTLYDT